MLSHVWLFVIPWTAAYQAPLSSTNFWSLLKFMSIESAIVSNHLLLCHSLLLLSSIFFSIRVFCLLYPSGGQSIGASAWVLAMNIQNWFPFRIDWFDLAVQGTLKSFLQHHNSKASVLWHLVFFMVQLSHPSMTTGNTIALITQTFVNRVMFLYVFLKQNIWPVNQIE